MLIHCVPEHTLRIHSILTNLSIQRVLYNNHDSKVTKYNRTNHDISFYKKTRFFLFFLLNMDKHAWCTTWIYSILDRTPIEHPLGVLMLVVFHQEFEFHSLQVTIHHDCFQNNPNHIGPIDPLSVQSGTFSYQHPRNETDCTDTEDDHNIVFPLDIIPSCSILTLCFQAG